MVVSNYSHTDVIKQKALEMGFSHVGVAKAEKLDTEATHFEQWLQSGYHADMHWMERSTERRIDPRNIVENAQSVVVVTFNYYSPEQHSSASDYGKISRYAWGDDYHETITPKVKELQGFIDSLEENTTSRSYVDTGPVMEKAWAARAGIGWIGKHTNLITQDIGSWVFLGVIITALKLECDTPISDFCGTCTECIDACPTDAIVEPYVVDSNKCIPYITIECKDEKLPSTHSMNFNNWIFGCDICQDVCPWNRFQVETTEKDFKPREFALKPKLQGILEMKDEEFRDAFRKSPVKRTKLKGLQRNARIVLAQNESNNREKDHH